MNASPSTLAELRCSNGAPRWLLNLVLPEIDGGRFTVADVAGVEVPASAAALRISGLDQASFESLVTQLGSRFRAIEFWKCPRIADLSPLEDLPHLRFGLVLLEPAGDSAVGPAEDAETRGAALRRLHPVA